MSQPFLAIVIPAYNAQAYIAPTLETVSAYLRKQEYTAQVLVVDDGSEDGPRQVVRAYLDEHEAPPELALIENDHRGKG